MPRFLLAALAIFTAASARGEDAVSLLRFIPNQANTICVINTAGILTSQRAVREGWDKKDHTEYLAGAVPVNPNVQMMLIAKDIDPTRLGEGGTLAVIQTNKPLALEEIAKNNGGKVSSIGDEPCAISPTGVYYFKLGDQLLGTVRTDNKQEISRWLKFTKAAKESQMPRFINAAAAQASRNHVTIGVDTEDMFHDHEIERAVAVSQSLQGQSDQARFITAFLRKLNGIQITINLTNAGIETRVRFSSSAYDFKIQPDAFKAFILEDASRNGALLQDMMTAKMTAGDNALTMTFMISDEELAHLMSLILPPAALPATRDAISIASDKPTAEATLRYFNAVNKILDDLEAQNKKAKDYEKTAVWHQTAANKIATLSVIGVDKAVIEYGYASAGRLQAIADSLNGVPAKVNELESQIYAIGNTRNIGLWGGRRGIHGGLGLNGGNMITNAGDIINRQAKVIKDDEKNRAKIWGMIDGQRSETRVKIVETYKVVPPDKK